MRVVVATLAFLVLVGAAAFAADAAAKAGSTPSIGCGGNPDCEEWEAQRCEDVAALRAARGQRGTGAYQVQEALIQRLIPSCERFKRKFGKPSACCQSLYDEEERSKKIGSLVDAIVRSTPGSPERKHLCEEVNAINGLVRPECEGLLSK